MRRIVLSLLTATLLPLLSVTPALAAGNNGPMGEEIRSMELCRLAVALDIKREGKQTDPAVICSLSYNLVPSYWQCVLDTMQRGPDLFSARRSCKY